LSKKQGVRRLHTIFENPRVTGVMVSYYFHCKRQLWFYANWVEMEHNSELVLLGKILSESFYRGKEKEVEIDWMIVMDWIDFRDGVVHEVKKSDRMEVSHIWQVKYYLYYLRGKGVKAKGRINYPKLRKVVDVDLGDGDIIVMGEVLRDILKVVGSGRPPARIEKRMCRGCSYFELCWS
jgi:CRISPR-associated exonuclease Cas4